MNRASPDRLSATNLTVGYKVNGLQQATLEQLNIAIRAGEFICLLGPNGTGKSTLIRTLAGIQLPLTGELKLQGKPYQSINPRERARQVSIVFTDMIPSGIMNGYSYTALGRHPYSGWMGGLDDTDHARIQWALEAIDATALSPRHVSELSDGERQKIAIARALAQEAQLMLLDEPTAFLDLPRRVELMRILRDLSHREQIGMLLSTHDLDLAIRYADRLWLIAPDGELIQGIPEALALSGALQRAFASNNLDWDPTSGSFRTHQTPLQFTTLEGNGTAALWTQRAFERIGVGITSDLKKAHFQTVLSQCEANTTWQLTHKGNTRHFTTIHDLIDWVLQQERCKRRMPR